MKWNGTERVKQREKFTSVNIKRQPNLAQIQNSIPYHGRVTGPIGNK